MANLGIINATNIKLYVVTEVGPPVVVTPVANATSGTLSVNQALRTSINKDDLGWEKSLPGARSWSMSGDSELAFDAAYGIDDLQAFIQARTPMSVKFSTESEGDTYFSGTAYLESIEVTGGTEENATYSYSLKGSGLLTKDVIPAPEP